MGCAARNLHFKTRSEAESGFDLVHTSGGRKTNHPGEPVGAEFREDRKHHDIRVQVRSFSGHDSVDYACALHSLEGWLDEV